MFGRRKSWARQMYVFVYWTVCTLNVLHSSNTFVSLFRLLLYLSFLSLIPRRLFFLSLLFTLLFYPRTLSPLNSVYIFGIILSIFSLLFLFFSPLNFNLPSSPYLPSFLSPSLFLLSLFVSSFLFTPFVRTIGRLSCRYPAKAACQRRLRRQYIYG